MSKKVIDEYGREVIVDDENKKLYSYCNARKEIVYNAEIIENGKHTGFWTNYTEHGTVDEIEDRLKVWNNKLRAAYALVVGFDSEKNDPDGAIYNNFIKNVRANSDKIFTKHGDFRKKLLISEDFIIKHFGVSENEQN